MEFVYGEGLLCQEKQLFFELLVASSSFQTSYARLLTLDPILPFVNFAIDTVQQLVADTNSILLLKQQALEGQSFAPVVFPLEPLAELLDVALEPFHLLVTLGGKPRMRIFQIP